MSSRYFLYISDSIYSIRIMVALNLMGIYFTLTPDLNSWGLFLNSNQISYYRVDYKKHMCNFAIFVQQPLTTLFYSPLPIYSNGFFRTRPAHSSTICFQTQPHVCLEESFAFLSIVLFSGHLFILLSDYTSANNH